MKQSVPEVFDAALALSDPDRAVLAEKLVESLDGDVDVGAEEAWAAEIEQRLAKIDAGQAKLLSADEAVTRLHLAVRGR